ncbi:MAG: hypothetical protein QXK96_02035, partial [Candidatus Bathyarchaeia archaeon]
MAGVTGYDMLLAVALPAATAPLCLVAGKKIGRVGNGLLATVTLGISTLLLAGSSQEVFSSGRAVENYGVWIGLFKLDAVLVQDLLSLTISLLIAGVSTLASIYSIAYMKDEHNQEMYFTSMLLFVCGMIGVVLSANLIM